MAFPAAFIDELIARNPIEDVVGQHVNLKRSGSNLFGLCPFHGEKTASFSVNPDKGIYYCFGCHKGGGVVNFQMEIEGLSYPDAVRALAKRVGMEVPEDEQYQSRYKQQERLWALHKEAARFFHSQLYAPIGAEALKYALGRGMSKSILTTFGVGYAPDSWDSMVKAMKAKGYTEQELIDADLVGQKNGRIYDRFRNRLMFPIIDVRGNVIGFGGRVLDDSKPKYLNSNETLIFNKRKNLFALNLAKKTKHDYLILVEGYMDAIALHQYGFDCAVASLGTALTEDGSAATGRYVIEDQTYFFSSTGENFLMVNRWNRIPADYTVELQYTPYGHRVSVECYDSLIAMLEDCRNAGFYPNLIDGYRSNGTQHYIFQKYLAFYLEEGNEYGTAYYLTKLRVADPGTSEHELGLAVDITDYIYSSSNLNPYHSLYWLSQHCWEYGWILRYPSGKSNITGIMYEPWHFRYVGVELAMELKDSGLCLEEYLDALTGDGSTCGNPNA